MDLHGPTGCHRPRRASIGSGEYLAANAASAIFVIAGLHLLYVNTRLLPRELRPGFWPRLGLVGLVVFYGFFSYLSFRALVS